MKNCLKKSLFVTAGLLIVGAGFFLGNPYSVSAAVQEGAKFNDWSVTCETIEKNKLCYLSQAVTSTPEKDSDPKNTNSTPQPQLIALYKVGYFGQGKDKSLKMIITVPANILVASGTSISTTDKLIIPGTYASCTAGNCHSTAAISNKDLKDLLASKQSSLVYMSPEGKQVNLPLSTQGLEAGIKALGK